MGKFKPLKLLVSVSVFTIIIVGLLASTSTDGSFGINLELPTNAFISFIGSDGETVQVEVADFLLEGVACWVQTELKVIDKDGNVIATSTSEFVKVNPSIPLAIFDADDIFTAGTELTGQGGFRVTPVIMCSVASSNLNPEHTFSEFFDNAGIPQTAEFISGLVIKPSELVVRMYSSDKSCGAGVDIQDETCKNITQNNALLFHDTYNAKLIINEQNINDNTKHSLGTLMIDDEDIESHLENGRYSSRMLITMDGLINIAYQVVPEYEYVIPLNTERTFIENFNHPFFGTNNWMLIETPLLLDRTLDVAHNVNACGVLDVIQGTCDCPPAQHIETVGGVEMCVPDSADPVCDVDEFFNGLFCEAIPVIPPTTCNPPLIQQGNICINPNQTGGIPSGQTGIIIIDQLISCLASGSPDCLLSPTFLPIWIGLVGLIIIIIAIAQGARKSSTDIYGVPTSY